MLKSIGVAARATLRGLQLGSQSSTVALQRFSGQMAAPRDRVAVQCRPLAALGETAVTSRVTCCACRSASRARAVVHSRLPAALCHSTVMPRDICHECGPAMLKAACTAALLRANCCFQTKGLKALQLLCKACCLHPCMKVQ